MQADLAGASTYAGVSNPARSLRSACRVREAGGRVRHALREYPREVVAVGEAAALGDLVDRQPRSEQQIGRAGDAPLLDVARRSATEHAPEHADEVRLARVRELRELRVRQQLGEVGVDVAERRLQLAARVEHHAVPERSRSAAVSRALATQRWISACARETWLAVAGAPASSPSSSPRASPSRSAFGSRTTGSSLEPGPAPPRLVTSSKSAASPGASPSGLASAASSGEIRTARPGGSAMARSGDTSTARPRSWKEKRQCGRPAAGAGGNRSA